MRKFRDEFWWKTENSIREKKSRERWEKKVEKQKFAFSFLHKITTTQFPTTFSNSHNPLPLLSLNNHKLLPAWAFFFCLLLSLQFEFRPPHRPHQNFIQINLHFFQYINISVWRTEEREEKSPKFFSYFLLVSFTSRLVLLSLGCHNNFSQLSSEGWKSNRRKDRKCGTFSALGSEHKMKTHKNLINFPQRSSTLAVKNRQRIETFPLHNETRHQHPPWHSLNFHSNSNQP